MKLQNMFLSIDFKILRNTTVITELSSDLNAIIVAVRPPPGANNGKLVARMALGRMK